MDPGYYTLIGLFAIGMAYGMYRRRRPARGNRGTAVALGLLALLMAGLYVASRLGNETLVWVFGLTLMAALPLMMFFSLGAALGKRLGRGESRDRDASEHPDRS